MNFGDAIQEVIVRTARADKAALIRQSINKAVMDLSRMKKFSLDLQHLEYEVPVQDQTKSIILIPITAFDRGVREIELIRGINACKGLDPVSSRDTMLGRQPRKGVYYVAEVGVYCSLTLPSDTIIGSYYAVPEPLINSTDTNWQLRHAFYEVVARASAILFKSIGEDKEATVLMNQSAIDYERVARDQT